MVLILHSGAQRCSAPSAHAHAEIILKCNFSINTTFNTLLGNEISPAALFLTSELIRTIPALQLWWSSSDRVLHQVWTFSCMTPELPELRSRPQGCLWGAGGGRLGRSSGASQEDLQGATEQTVKENIMFKFTRKQHNKQKCMFGNIHMHMCVLVLAYGRLNFLGLCECKRGVNRYLHWKNLQLQDCEYNIWVQVYILN